MSPLQLPFKSAYNAGRRLKEAANMARGGTIIVHPQLARTFEEAQTLSKSWKAREKKQAMDNIAEAMRRM